MTGTEVRVVPCDEVGPAEAASAWLVPGSDVARWLVELDECGLLRPDLRLLVLPASRAARAASAAIAFVPEALGTTIEPGPLRPWARAGSWLHPSEAELVPPLAVHEREALVPAAHVVLHPALGAVAFDAADVLALEDLVEPPRERPAETWHADPGTRSAPRLVAVTAEQSPSVAEVFEEPRRSIASESPFEGLDDAETRARRRAPGTPWPVRLVARAVLRFHLWAPGTASGPTWIDRLAGWARARLAAGPHGRYPRGSSLDERRRRALERLLVQLKDDPERGLRTALPLWGPAGRGLAPPDDRLGLRAVDYSAGELAASKSVDAWHVDPQMHARLAQRYRELANLEIERGRHRRAAYILAHLLGDLHSAARALEDGRHWREAAALYVEKLSAPDDAAACLARGGMLAEAAELFTGLAKHREAGDLWKRLEQPERAGDAYRRAADLALATGDHLECARLLEVELSDPDRALAALAEAWPSSHQAETAVLARLGLLQRLGRADDARACLGALAAGAGEQRALSLRTLVSVASSELDPALRIVAADHARVVVGSGLATASGQDARRMLGALRALAPGDRLLARDTERYGRRLSVPSAAPPPHTLPVVLPPEILWQALGQSRQHLVAAGTSRDGRARAVAYHDWDAAPVVRVLPGPARGGLWLSRIGTTESLLLGFREPHPFVTLAPPTWPRQIRPTPPADVLHAAIDDALRLIVVSGTADSLVLRTFDRGGELVSSHEVAPARGAVGCQIEPLGKHQFLMALGAELRCYHQRVLQTRIELDGPIAAISVLRLGAFQHLVVVATEGWVTVVAFDSKLFRVEKRIATGGVARLTALRPPALVAATDGGAWLVERPYAGGPVAVVERDVPATTAGIVAIAPGPRRWSIAMLAADGRVGILHLRR